MKGYEVNIDMRWSKTITVHAKSESEAKRKAWFKFIKKIPKRLFVMTAEKFCD